MKNLIEQLLSESIQTKEKLLKDPAAVQRIADGAELLLQTIKAGGTIFSCGNGGSTCDAMHLTEELVARYKRERPGIKAMHLMDPSVLTCWSNDYSFQSVFARQIETFGSEKDCLVALSTSGTSKNIIAAAEAAKQKSMKCIGLSGDTGGTLKALCNVMLTVPAKTSDRIQEVHITVIHMWCEIIERELFEKA